MRNMNRITELFNFPSAFDLMVPMQNLSKWNRTTYSEEYRKIIIYLDEYNNSNGGF